MAEHNTLYKKADYYDIIFARDVHTEVDFILEIFRQYAGHEAQAALDLACGPGYHALEMARRGLRTVGLDLNTEMVALGQQKAEKEGLAMQWIAQDLRTFSLDAPVDIAMVIFDGLDVLLKNEDVIAHFQAVAANLTPNGIYLIDLSPPNMYSVVDYTTTYYHGERDGVQVDIIWAGEKPVVDLVAGVVEVGVEMRIMQNGEVISIHDKAFERMFVPQELALLAECSGALRVVGWYGAFDCQQPFDDSASTERMIAVLQKG